MQETRLFPKENLTFVWGSGHVAGIINHPNKNKYWYKTNPNLKDNPQEWEKFKKKHVFYMVAALVTVGEKFGTTKVSGKRSRKRRFSTNRKSPGAYARKNANNRKCYIDMRAHLLLFLLTTLDYSLMKGAETAALEAINYA